MDFEAFQNETCGILEVSGFWLERGFRKPLKLVGKTASKDIVLLSSVIIEGF